MIIINIARLEEALTKAVADFQENVKAYCEAKKGEITEYDLEELGKHTFYALNDFKSAIIEHLKKTK